MLNLHHNGHLTLEGLEEFGVCPVLGFINHFDGILLPSGLINSKLDISKVSAGRDYLTAKRGQYVEMGTENEKEEEEEGW